MRDRNQKEIQPGISVPYRRLVDYLAGDPALGFVRHGVIKTVPRLRWTNTITDALPTDLIPGLLALGVFLAAICGMPTV